MEERVARMAFNAGEAWSQTAPRARRFLIAGAIGCVVVLVAMLVQPTIALRAWLAAATLWMGIPIGALAILMMIRLIPGEWSAELTLPMEAAILLVPLAAIVFLPVLFGMGALYEWAHQEQRTAFRSVYLSEWFLVVRTIVWFAILAALAFLLLARRTWATPVSSVGLIVFTAVNTFIATDWLMSLDPEFTSSGFGLYVISIQMTIAMAVGVTTALGFAGAGIRSPQVLGVLLLTALLFWTYLAFMQFVIIWSENFPQEAAWYLHRSGGVWSAVLWAIAVLHGVPTFLLMLPPVLRNRRALIVLAASVLFGKALECAWLVLPARGVQAGWSGAVLFVIAVLGLGALFAVALVWAFDARVRARAPRPDVGGMAHG